MEPEKLPFTNPSEAIEEDGCCYVIEFDNGVVKPGKSKNLLHRYRSHKDMAKKFGISIRTIAFTDPHQGYSETEKTFIKLIAAISKYNTGEYFRGVKFHDAISLIQDYGINLNFASEILGIKEDGRLQITTSLDKRYTPIKEKKLDLRLTDDQKEQIYAAALEAGMPVSKWCLSILLAEAEKIDGKRK